MKRIHDSLSHVFSHHRIVFWYDAKGEWLDAFESFEDASVTKLRVEGTEFGAKVRVLRDPDPTAKFLLYFPSARPADAGNWLLDLLLQGHEYKADRASLTLQEVGLPHEFLHLAEEHAGFFAVPEQTQALKGLLAKEDAPRTIRLKMMSVLAGTDADADAILLAFLASRADGDLLDPVKVAFDPSGLSEYFWKEVATAFSYASLTPTLRDFGVTLFRSANPLDCTVRLHPHAKVFLQRWKDSQKHGKAFARWSHQMERELKVAEALDNLGDNAKVGDSDTFELFDKFTLHRLCAAFVKNTSATDLQKIIQSRRGSFWQKQHEQGYAALSCAVELRELLASAELTLDSPLAGLNRYVGSWWRIDAAYRNCIWNLRRYSQAQVMEPVAQWVEKHYVNNFLLPLADRWSDQVRAMAAWKCDGANDQRNFFDLYVQPFVAREAKVFVIISDALRFEAASEFARRLRVESRWTTEVEWLLGSLPSYTQLGMAALLPGRTRALDTANATVTVDGRSATGTENRVEILRHACNGRATAIPAGEFLELNTKTGGRDLMRDHEVIYIFHSTIDTIGHSVGTEAKTFDAVEQAFQELELIVKKVANINGTNMLLTADHGFLFQQDEVADEDGVPLPPADTLTHRDRRFLLGKGIASTPQVKVFSSEALGVQGDWCAAFPLSLGRFPLQGAGKRFVHGGTSLQEVVVPVVRIHKARSDDTVKVEVLLTQTPAKITTGKFSITLLQEDPVADKMLPRTLRIGLYTRDGTPLSETKTVTFDSRATDARQRESRHLLVLAKSADAFNNRDVELRLEETLPGTSQNVVYRSHPLRIQKSFASDFDEH
jgi:uncharacterized protein (TIGR02687 family)